MIKNHTSINLYNERFSKSSEEKCAAFQSIAWSFIVHENTTKTAQLFYKHFPPGLFFFVSFIFFFIKARIRLQFLTKAVARRCSAKKVFIKISKNSQENTCARVSFSIKLQAALATLLKKGGSGIGVFL